MLYFELRLRGLRQLHSALADAYLLAGRMGENGALTVIAIGYAVRVLEDERMEDEMPGIREDGGVAEGVVNLHGWLEWKCWILVHSVLSEEWFLWTLLVNGECLLKTRDAILKRHGVCINNVFMMCVLSVLQHLEKKMFSRHITRALIDIPHSHLQ